MAEIVFPSTLTEQLNAYGQRLQEEAQVAANKATSFLHERVVAKARMSGGEISQFRYDLIVRVMGHPVTANPGSGSPGDGVNGAILAYKFINCWTASVGFSGLNASDNAIVVQQMTVHHEGFGVYFGSTDAVSVPI